jgi:D-alanine transfer protein
MMAQKIAALGEAVRGRKMAFIICHFWFRRSQTPASHVAGNFSPLQTITFLQDPALQEGLRRRFVHRLLEYPTATDDYRLIDAYLHSMQEETGAAAVRRGFLDPLLRLQHAWLTWDDRIGSVEALFKYGLLGDPSSEEKPAHIPWAQLIEKKEGEVPEEQKRQLENNARLNNGSGDEEFLTPLRKAKEWDDFALLLDTLKYYQADPLFISVPLPGPRLDRFNVSRSAREYFHNRVTELCRERNFAVETFRDQELAIDFLEGSGTHLEEKGWIYVDRLLDDFYHNRIPAAGEAK